MTGRGVQKSFVGVVVSNKMDKTAVVMVSRIKKHRTYEKYVKSQVKYMAHDPQNRCRLGDRVRIIETRPISKRKGWQVIEIIERSAVEESEQKDSALLGQAK